MGRERKETRRAGNELLGPGRVPTCEEGRNDESARSEERRRRRRYEVGGGLTSRSMQTFGSRRGANALKNPEQAEDSKRDEFSSSFENEEVLEREVELTSMTIDFLRVVLLQTEDDLTRHHLLPFPFPKVVIVCFEHQNETTPPKTRQFFFFGSLSL